jgi:CDP-glucose 4,6-dehydratase
MVSESTLRNFYKGKRVFMTGHTGFKGSWLSIILNWLGAEVHGYSLEPPTNPSLFDIAHLDRIVGSTIGDVRDYELLVSSLAGFRPEIVIHMAAQPLVRESYRNPRETYEVNVMGTVNLFEASRSVSSIKAILNVTTDKCYENKEWLWGYRENETLGGFDPYSNSKACSELVTASFRNSFFNPNDYNVHGIAIGSARAGNVIGGGDWAADRLIPDFIRAISEGKQVDIRNPYAVRPWQHVMEPLTGYLQLSMKLFKEGPAYAEGWNFGPDNDDARNVEWIVQKICALWGDNASYSIDNGQHPHEAGYLRLDCSKAKSRLGWFPRLRTDTSLELIVDWYKSYSRGMDMHKITLDQIEKFFSM